MPTKPKPKLDPLVESFYHQLLEEGNLDDDQINLVHDLLGHDNIAKVFKSGVSARKLVDKERSELATEKQKLENDISRRIRELDSLQRTLASTPSADTKKLAQLEQAIRDKDSLLSNRESQLKRVVEVLKGYQTGGDEVLREAGLTNLDFSTPSPTPSTSSNPPPQQTLTIEDVLNKLNPMLSTNARALGKLPFDLIRYGREYKELTGKDFNETEFYNRVTKEAELNNGVVDYEQVYLRDYDIENLKEQKKTDSLRATIEQEYKDKLEMELSKRLAGGGSHQPSKDSAFYNAIESTIPESERNNNPGGLTDRPTIVSEAVRDYMNRQPQASST